MFRKLLSHKKAEKNNVHKMLYEMFYDKAYRTAYFITQDKHLTDDIVQETFIKVFENIEKLQDYSKIEGWISTITRNTAIDFLRKQNKWNEMITSDVIHMNKHKMTENYSVVESKVEMLLTMEEIKEALQHLAAIHREIFLLKIIENLSDNEIAEQLNISVGTVKSRYFRAKEQMRRLCSRQRIKGGDNA